MIQRVVLPLWIVCFASFPVCADDAVFDSNGVPIRFVTAGNGEAVVLIHGWMADSGMWGRDRSGNTRLNVDGLDGFQLIALDCRGHGQSGKSYDPDDYGLEMAADVVRLLDHLEIERAHLIGYSSGAYIAGHVVATAPHRVRSVIYAGQAPLIPDTDSTDFSEVDTFAAAVESDDLGSYILAVSPDNRTKPTAEQAKKIAAFVFDKKDVKAFAAAGRSFGDLMVSVDQLHQCDAPVLFIYGGNESEHVHQRVTAVHQKLGRGEVKVIEGGDHMTTLAKPEFREAIVSFLKAASEQR